MQTPETGVYTVQPYLVITDRPSTWGYRITREMPRLEPNEIVIRLNLEIPKALFQRPVLEAKIVLPLSEQQVVSAEVIDQIEQAVKQGTGVSVNLMLVEPEEK